MSVSLSPIGGAASQFFNSGGVPLYGGKIYTYEAGTTTPKATYTEANGLTAHTNPIILDSAGRVPGGEIWLTSAQAYLFILKTSSDELIGTYDNIYGINAGSENAVTETQVATAGQTNFVLTSMTYTPGVFTLGVYIDGVNQVVNNSYVETSATTVTFVSGLHVGALVKFTNINSAATDSNVVSYLPAGAGAVATNVQAALRPIINAADYATPQQAIDAAISQKARELWFPDGTYTVTAPASEPGTQSYSAALVVDGLKGCKIHGSKNAIIAAGTGGAGAVAFALFRLQRCENVEICNLGLDGDYANHSGQAGSRSWGIILSTFDVSTPTTDLGESRNIHIHDIECNDIGGFVLVANRNEALARQLNVYDLRVEHCRGHNAAQAANVIGLNYTVGFSVKHNRFTNDTLTGTEYATMYVDASRGCEDGEVAFNYGDNFNYGMKAESVTGSGPLANEDRFSKNIKFANNELLQIGNPTAAAPGSGVDPGAGGTYGMRLNGVDIEAVDNRISGLTTFTGSAGMQTGIYPLITHSSDATISIRNNLVERGQWNIQQSSGAAGSLTEKQSIEIKNNELRNAVLDGVIAQARCVVEENRIYEAGRYSVNAQVCDQTRVNRNKAYNCGAAAQDGVFYQEEAGVLSGYFEFLDNDVFDSRGGSAAAYAYKFIAGTNYANTYGYRPGVASGVAISLTKYVGSVFDAGKALMTVVGNPAALTISTEHNVASLTNVDAFTVQVNFKRAVPTADFVYSSIVDPNLTTRRWLPWGNTTAYARFRYTDMAGVAQNLPTGIAMAIY